MIHDWFIVVYGTVSCRVNISSCGPPTVVTADRDTIIAWTHRGDNSFAQFQGSTWGLYKVPTTYASKSLKLNNEDWKLVYTGTAYLLRSEYLWHHSDTFYIIYITVPAMLEGKLYVHMPVPHTY
jgi:hypothetical protein